VVSGGEFDIKGEGAGGMAQKGESGMSTEKMYVNALTSVAHFLEELKTLVIAFDPGFYNEHGYVEVPAVGAKNYEVVMQRKSLCDKFAKFWFDKNNWRTHIQCGSNEEVKIKMSGMYGEILAVDLETLAEKYPYYTFAKINAAKADALVGLTTWLRAHGEKIEKIDAGTGGKGAFDSRPRAEMEAMRGLLAEMGALR
jgi:hypothetical protein